MAESVVANIRRVMLDKGISQAELARTLGMSPSQLSSILRDEDYNFTLRMLRRFAAALGTDLKVRIGEPVPEAPMVLASGGPVAYARITRIDTNADEKNDYAIFKEEWTAIGEVKDVSFTLTTAWEEPV